MAKITVNRENFKVEERELTQGSLNIGRNKDNQLRIDDPAVSNHHAKIVTVFDSTFVNGKQVKTHTLHNGDVLTIGHYQILFQSEHAAPQHDVNSTMMIGVSQLEELTKKARLSKLNATDNQNPAAKPAVQKPAATTISANGKPRLQVHENDGQLIPDNTELPDIDDSANILGQTLRVSPAPGMYNRRKSDLSPMPSLKVIALAVLATVATFTVLMLIFK